MVEQGLGNCRGSEQRDSTREPEVNHLDSGSHRNQIFTVTHLEASQNARSFPFQLSNPPSHRFNHSSSPDFHLFVDEWRFSTFFFSKKDSLKILLTQWFQVLLIRKEEIILHSIQLN